MNGGSCGFTEKGRVVVVAGGAEWGRGWWGSFWVYPAASLKPLERVRLHQRGEERRPAKPVLANALWEQSVASFTTGLKLAG